MFKYSIVMPVYNSSNFLDRSISSIVNQSLKNWELIIVDDGSTDNSSEIIKKYADINDNIKYYYQENSGPGKARNLGISKCNGDYICFIDADDYFESDYLTAVNDELLKNEYDVVFIGLFLEKASGKIDKILNFEAFKGFSRNELIKSLVMGKLPWGAYNKVVKSDIIKKCNFSELSVGEEILYTFDVIYNSNSFDFFNKPLYHYIHNENGQHKKGGDDPWRPVVSVMQNHLSKLNMIESYRQYLDILAIKAISISIYRCFTNYKYKDAVNKIKEIVKYYKSNYNIFEVNNKLLPNSYKLITFLLKTNNYFLLFLASKLRNLK